MLLRRRACLTLQWSDTVQCCTGRCWRKKLIQKIFQSSLKQLWVLSYLYKRCYKSKYCSITLRVQFDQLCQKISEILVKIWTELFSPSGNLPKNVAHPRGVSLWLVGLQKFPFPVLLCWEVILKKFDWNVTKTRGPGWKLLFQTSNVVPLSIGCVVRLIYDRSV